MLRSSSCRPAAPNRASCATAGGLRANGSDDARTLDSAAALLLLGGCAAPAAPRSGAAARSATSLALALASPLLRCAAAPPAGAGALAEARRPARGCCCASRWSCWHGFRPGCGGAAAADAARARGAGTLIGLVSDARMQPLLPRGLTPTSPSADLERR